LHSHAPLQNIDAAATLVAKLAVSAGGLVESSNVQHAGGDGSDEEDADPHRWRPQSTAQVACRVPADKLDALLAQLRAAFSADPASPLPGRASRVLSESVTVRDASGEYVDAAARERVERASLAQMEELLRQAGSVGDVLAVRREMQAITSRLESARAQRQVLESKAAMSTLSVHVATPPWKAPPRPRQGWSLLSTAARALQALLTLGQACADVLVFAAVFALPVTAALWALFGAGKVLAPRLLPTGWFARQWAAVGAAAGGGSGASVRPGGGGGASSGGRGEE
jgi:hypothetical protein